VRRGLIILKDLIRMVYEVSNSKALIGAAFIQYLVYAVFYVIEGFKKEEFDQTEAEAKTRERQTA